MAALVDVMVVAVGTFEWAEVLESLLKCPNTIFFIGILVAVITILLHMKKFGFA
jgi:hypothetical protein